MELKAHYSQPTYLSSIWLLMGIIIFIGNIFTSLIIWLRKASQEKSRFGLRWHASYNLLGVDIAFSLVGLTLATICIIRLTKGGEISETACKFLGFCHTFGFHFAAVGLLVFQADKLYCFLKPFAYHVYSRTKSNVPLIVFICCTAYGMLIATLPLTKLGSYSSRTAYTNCILKWNQNSAVRATLSLNTVLFVLTIVLITANLYQKWRLVQNRRQLSVAVSHRKETIIFVLIISSLFLVCWLPYLVAMLVSTFFSEDHPDDTTKAVLSSITLIPLVLNPVLTFCLRADCRDEYIKLWTNISKYFDLPKKKIQTERSNCVKTAVSVVTIKMKTCEKQLSEGNCQEN